ncbi:MAG: DnaJ domain-containing protein [Candidatus Paceibacterota bacterium]|jgi:curved DNA-binding protein CbpA
MKNPYQILGVTPTANIAEIKDAYRKLSVQWHPDKNNGPEAQQRFAAISESYMILSDPHKRQELDGEISKNQIENINEVVERVVDSYLDSLVERK